MTAQQNARRIMRRSILPLLFCLLGACYPDVEYEIKDDGLTLSCKDYDDKSRYDTEGYTFVTCTWYCHNYQGHSGAYVSLTFISEGNDGWYLDSTFIDDEGICN
jgi:hypothetical protein